MAFLNSLKRNFVSILFPTVTTALIFLDWNHTRNWKKQLKSLEN